MFEHDIYLAKTWFPTIPLAVLDRNLDGANGIRNRNVRGFRESDIYDNAHRLIVSEDNSFYATKPSTGRYEVIRSVISIHLRQNTRQALRHGYFIYREVNSEPLQKHLKSIGKSSVLALRIGIETASIAPIIVYPLERTLYLFGAIAHSFK
jgi:hypothetical protein